MAGTIIVSSIKTDTDNSFIVRSNTGATLFSVDTTSISIPDGSITSAMIANGTVIAADVADGSITDAKITAVANTKITGLITGSQLANTAVTAGVYGGSSAIPVVTVDAQGRITSASNTALSLSGNSTTTTSAVDITLTSSSNRVQNVTMTALNKKVILPDATTLTTGGPTFVISNAGTFPINITLADGSSQIVRLAPLTTVLLFLVNNSTSNGYWATEDSSLSVSYTDYSTVVAAGSYVNSGTWNTGYYSTNINSSRISDTSSLITYSSGTSGRDVYGIVASISGTTISYGSATLLYSGSSTAATSHQQTMLSSSNGLIIVARASNVVAVPVTISGTTITVGTTSATFGQANPTSVYNCLGQMAVMDSTTLLLNTISGTTTPYSTVFRTIIHNGTSAPTLSTATAGTQIFDYYTPGSLTYLTSTTALYLYPAITTGYLYAKVITVSGSSTPTLGTAATTTLNILTLGNSYMQGWPAYRVSATEVIVYGGYGSANWTVSGTTPSYTGYIVYGTTSGNTFGQETCGAPIVFNENAFNLHYNTDGVRVYKKVGSYIYAKGPIYFPYSSSSLVNAGYGYASSLCQLSSSTGLLVTNSTDPTGPIYALLITYIGS